jgi:hypothetical protein
LPLAFPWSSQSCPFWFGSGRQSAPEFPCEQSSPGDPGTVVGGPLPLPGSAKAADTPMPAISRPTIAASFAAVNFHPVMQVLSFRGRVLPTASHSPKQPSAPSGSSWEDTGARARHEGPDPTRPRGQGTQPSRCTYLQGFLGPEPCYTTAARGRRSVPSRSHTQLEGEGSQKGVGNA